MRCLYNSGKRRSYETLKPKYPTGEKHGSQIEYPGEVKFDSADETPPNLVKLASNI